MAGDWIKMRTNLDTDPAVVRISSGLQTDRYSGVGRLHKIWAWANEHLTDGQDVPVDAEFLDCLVEAPGFSAQLRHVGWLSGRDGSLSFPNFERHNGVSAKARAQDAARKKCVREMSGSQPDKNRTREEKRREESIKASKDAFSAEQSSPPDGDSGFVFAMQGGPWHLPDKKLAEYVATYSFDVHGELRKAAQWLRDNKARRPRSASGVQRFLTSWLNRVDERKPESAKLGGKIVVDEKLKAEMARARKIREEKKREQIPDIPGQPGVEG